jgi:hypothetical protein
MQSCSATTAQLQSKCSIGGNTYFLLYSLHRKADRKRGREAGRNEVEGSTLDGLDIKEQATACLAKSLG